MHSLFTHFHWKNIPLQMLFDLLVFQRSNYRPEFMPCREIRIHEWDIRAQGWVLRRRMRAFSQCHLLWLFLTIIYNYVVFQWLNWIANQPDSFHITSNRIWDLLTHQNREKKGLFPQAPGDQKWWNDCVHEIRVISSWDKLHQTWVPYPSRKN